MQTVYILSKASCCPDVAWPQAEEAIRAELQLLDVTVELVTHDDMTPDQHLLTAERGVSIAAVQVMRSAVEPDMVEIHLWIPENESQGGSLRHLTITDETSGDNAALAGVLAVEALRAGLQLPGKAAPSAVQKAAAKKERPPMGRAVCAHFLLADSIGLHGPRFGPALGFTWQPDRWIDLIAMLKWIPGGPDVVGQDARSTFQYLGLNGWIAFQVFKWRLLRLGMGAGGGLVLAFSRGTRTEEGTLRSVMTAVGYLGSIARLQLRITDRVHLLLRGTVGLLIPEIAVTHNGQQVAAIGRPLFDGSLGVMIWF